MEIKDPLYGTTTVEDPVLQALLASEPVERLQHVQQLGMPPEYTRFPGFSRFEHSAGVCLLLKQFNASLTEQVAGLLHDVAHTAFSHVMDWVFDNMDQEDFHDTVQQQYLQETSIPGILEEHGFDLGQVTALDSYDLLKQPRPHLCVDRFDYALREFHYWLHPDIVSTCRDDTAVAEGKLVFTSEETAITFATHFLRLQSEHWGSPGHLVRWHVFSRLLKHAFKHGIIREEDVFNTDTAVMEKLVAADDAAVNTVLTYLAEGAPYTHVPDGGIHLKKTFRHVDPAVKTPQGTAKLSSIDQGFNKLLHLEKRRHRRGFHVTLPEDLTDTAPFL